MSPVQGFAQGSESEMFKAMNMWKGLSWETLLKVLNTAYPGSPGLLAAEIELTKRIYAAG